MAGECERGFEKVCQFRLDMNAGRRPMWPRAAILQTGQASGVVAIDPFTHRARANACGFADGLRVFVLHPEPF